MEEDAASLRKAAPNWSLAGDKELLGMLQKIHQTILTKCKEANGKLDAMVDALDNASIDLQNVNNKFMALSNSQFVESRVYDDDIDITTEGNVQKTEPQKVEADSEITKLKRSLQRLEQMHEPVHILDSDSSDDEDEGRIILKPKDVYTHRPLPYIIGSQAWKSKWHAGLLQEESDSDSSVSKRENIPAEEYSESEPETAPTDKLANRTISSSSIESEVTPQSHVTTQVTRLPTKPADIAAELARRLGGQPVQLPGSDPVPIESPPVPTTNKVYRVEKPAPTTIFSDEPPPLDDDQSYKSDYTDDDDIFAELHKKPYPSANVHQNRVSKDLFGGLNDNIVDDLFGDEERHDTDIGNVIDYQDTEPSTSGIQKRPLLSGIQGLNASSEKPVPKLEPVETKPDTESTVKKPVGGISLFGNNKGAESIGAAILKRNQRKSSTSDEDSSNVIDNKIKVTNIVKTKEEPVNKIIEDLFNKPVKKGLKKEDKIKIVEPEKVKPVKDKIDLFSDNLFDDIDDIFTTNIVTKPKDNKSQKSIFDDDDLFADVTIKKLEYSNNKVETKNIFDGSDELFTENEKTVKADVKIPSNPINVHKDDSMDEGNDKLDKSVKKIEIVSKNTRSLFDEDNEDDLFLYNNAVNEIPKSQKLTTETIEKVDDNVINRETPLGIETVSKDINNQLLNKSSERKNVKKLAKTVSSKSELESSSLFDEDKFDDLFNSKRISSTEDNKLNNVEEMNRVNEIIEHDKNSESMKENIFVDNVTIPKDVEPQISDNIAETRQGKEQNTEIGNDIIESHDISLKNNAVPAEANVNIITDDVIPPKIIQPVVTDSEKITRNSSPTFLENLDDNTNGIYHAKQPEISCEEIVDTSDTSIPGPKTLDANESGIFSEIFVNMPPAFEKPIESKKSKNVNALFDDDSDDEALFFKKNEGISDEKPDINYSADRFRIFHDEPPEIEIDFSQKPFKNNSTSFSEVSDDELFSDLPKFHKEVSVTNVLKDDTKEVNNSRDNIGSIEENVIQNVVNITKLIEDSKTTGENREIDVTKLLEDSERNNKIYNVIENNNVFDTITDDGNVKQGFNETEKFVKSDQLEENEPKKSVGKLKPMNFNINVNTLLPGASLNRSKPNEEIDGQTISSKSNEELNIHIREKTETTLVKSVSFDGDPESKVLDNKLSKQRAKIQVKRRPSSRRARLEAVRKSGVDFTSDSTDNSSSFDEPPYKEVVHTKTLEDKVNSTIITQQKSTSSESVITNTSTTTTQKPIENVVDTKTQVKSKVVYILNDEDIFTDINPRKEVNNESGRTQNKTNLSIVEDDDEFLFKTTNISTLGKTYENKIVSSLDDQKIEPETSMSKQSGHKNKAIEKENFCKTKKSLFDDLSDDEGELFGGKKPTVQRNNIFDSDSEGELFVKSKRESKSTVAAKKEAVKGSLFGDESDDDSNLFEVRKTSGNLRQIPIPKKTAVKASEPVFEDPLSMFGDDS